MKTRKRGAILLEILIGLLMLSIISAAFFSLFPMIRKAHIMSKQESHAVHVSSRLIEHLQMLKPADLNEGAILTLNLADYRENDGTYVFSELPMDDASIYSPAKQLADGKGEFWIEELANGSKRVEVEVSWRAPSGVTRSVVSGTIIGGYK